MEVAYKHLSRVSTHISRPGDSKSELTEFFPFVLIKVKHNPQFVGAELWPSKTPFMHIVAYTRQNIRPRPSRSCVKLYF